MEPDAVLQPREGLGPLDAAVLDTDGVITRTADVHRRAWGRLFDEYLAERSGGAERPFSDDDYLRYVDGKPRYDGTDSFLRSRGIELPRGEPSDEPGTETVCGLGNGKNRYFRGELEEHGVDAFDSTVELVERMRAAGVQVAAVSASENQRAVLDAAGLADGFDVLVDGVMSREAGLPGKPDPALFVEAARRLGVEPARAAVLEDAQSGVAAGRAGGFAAVIGVDRGGNRDALLAAGADVVVDDAGELLFEERSDGCYLRVEGP